LINLIGFKVNDKQIKDANNKFDKLKAGLKTVGTIALAAVASIGTLALKTAADMEAMNAQFEVLTGSAERANKLVKELIDFAAATPFRLEDLSKGTKTLLNFGVGSEEVLPILQNLGDIAGGSSEKLQTLALVFGQIKGLGKLQGQDWRQLINVGFNPLQIMADKTGKSMGQLQEEMSKGLITFDMFAETLKVATSEGGMFYQNMLKASKTVQGVWSTMSDNFVLALGQAANKALPKLKELMLQIIPLLQKPFVELTTGIVDSLMPILSALVGLLKPLFNLLIPIVKILSDTLGFVGKILATTVIPFVESLANMLTPVLNDLSDILNELFITLEPIIGTILNLMIILIKQYMYPFIIQLKLILTILKPLFFILNTVLNPFFTALNKILEVINKLIDAVMLLFYDILDKAISWISEKLFGIKTGFMDIFSGIGEFFTKIINSVIDGLNWLIEKTNKIAKTKIELIERIVGVDKTINEINNNQKTQNINMDTNINLQGGTPGSQNSNRQIANAAGTLFNLQLKKVLIENGGL